MRLNLNRIAKKVVMSSRALANKHGAEIAVKGGAALILAGTGLAIAKSRKAVEIIDNTKGELEDLHYIKENGYIAINDIDVDVEMDDAEYRKEVVKTYGLALWEFVKLYFDVVLVEGVGMLLVFKGVKNFKIKEMDALATAATFKTAYDKLCERVEDKYGPEEAFKLKHGIEDKEYEDYEVDAKGKKKKTQEKIEVVKSDLEDYSPYAKFFDSSSKYFEKNAEYNMFFLRSMETYANQKLAKDGFLFLNDVYSALGIPQTQAGQRVGWRYNDEKKVSFGIYDKARRANADFVNGYEPVIILDFNVDGDILSCLPAKI